MGETGVNRFPSTLLPQRAGDVKETQKAILDLLDKVNKIAEAQSGSGSGLKSVSTGYNFTATDGVTDLFVTTGSATITVTLDRSARNVGRLVRVWKADAGTGEVKVAGAVVGTTTETISGFASVYVGLQYQHADIYQDGTVNFNVGQYIQPMAGQPAWGVKHTDTQVLVSGVDPATTTDQTVTCSTVADGSTAIFGRYSVKQASAGQYVVNIKNMAGSIFTECVTYQTASLFHTGWFEVPLDENKQFLWNATDTAIDYVAIIQLGYYK